MASGLSHSFGCPDQSDSSLSWNRSSGSPPKIIAPSRPLPMGSASTQWLAGAVYQRTDDCAMKISL